MARQQRKPKKPLQPGNLIFLAVLSYVLGFPLWVTVALVAGAFIVWRLRKQDKALEHLPLPPQNADNEANPHGDSLGDSLGHTWGRTGSPDEVLSKDMSTDEPARPMVPEQRGHMRGEEGLANQYRDATLDSLPVYTPKTDTTSPGISISAKPKQTPTYGSLQSPRHVHPLAHSLRSRNGLRQAIIAMTVLGTPRSLDPYRPEPQQRADITPPAR